MGTSLIRVGVALLSNWVLVLSWLVALLVLVYRIRLAENLLWDDIPWSFFKHSWGQPSFTPLLSCQRPIWYPDDFIIKPGSQTLHPLTIKSAQQLFFPFLSFSMAVWYRILSPDSLSPFPSPWQLRISLQIVNRFALWASVLSLTQARLIPL